VPARRAGDGRIVCPAVSWKGCARERWTDMGASLLLCSDAARSGGRAYKCCLPHIIPILQDNICVIAIDGPTSRIGRRTSIGLAIANGSHRQAARLALMYRRSSG
jgi:hypothetical protein